MFYSLAPSKGLNPRKFCWWDPRSGIFYSLNPESWALESRIQPKKSIIPLTTDIQFHLQRLESSTWNPECKAWNPEPRTVFDSHKWGKQTHIRADRPTHGANRPIHGANRPIHGSNRPIHGANRPIRGANSQSVG